jgi:hypothetical protein
MLDKTNIEQKIVNVFLNYYVEKTDRKKLIAIYDFNTSGSFKFYLHYVLDNGETVKTKLSIRNIVNELQAVVKIFHDKINSNERFNNVEFNIVSKDEFEITYKWNEQKEIKEKKDSANIFFQWTNDTMMNRIFDYEKENDLLTANFDEDGDLIDYQNSWDNGLFEFTINENKVSHKITLSKNEMKRNLPMPLPEYFITGLLEHHLITNKELTDEWKPWNKLVIKSPHNDIPYHKWKDYVEYSLETKN